MEPARRDPFPSGKLAIWIFLASEVMFFSGLIGSYLVLRLSNPEAFHPEFLAKTFGSKLSEPLAGFNTLVLICSSLTMVLAVQGVSQKNNAKVRKFLFATAALGTLFCVVKAFEYGAKFSHHIYPNTSIFFSCYFTTTGVHLLHVIGGIVPLALFGVLARDGRFIKEGNQTVELLGLYWHFVDVVWIFLFPLLYLIK
jgi:cytochrome c oxidase subunit 3